MSRINVGDLAPVIYSCGKVFDGLQTGRLDTEDFLRTGTTSGISSMQDLALLSDLKQAAELVIEHRPHPVDVDFLLRLNASMTRSASFEPGALRRDDEHIGVATVFGRHEPPAVTTEQLEHLVRDALASNNHQRNAAMLFLAIAKAQPFKDGNKRAGIFAANAQLLSHGDGELLTVPMSEDDPSVAQRFNEKLARAYIFNEDEPVIETLIHEGIIESALRAQHSPAEADEPRN